MFEQIDLKNGELRTLTLPKKIALHFSGLTEMLYKLYKGLRSYSSVYITQ